MRENCILVNTARGGIINEKDLIWALINRKIYGAGLDVFAEEPPDLSSPLFNLSNVISTPHISGATDGTSRKRARCTADNVERIAAGLEPLYRVDL